MDEDLSYRLTVDQGQVEYELIGHAKRNPAVFESYILRPGAILDEGYSLRKIAWSLGPSVRVEALARAMIDIALNGFEKDTLENKDVGEWDAGVRNPQ
ncbi:hypothetical protein SLS53_003930 [Cytospora paraplurivora]|uniref:Uncharacterized protein n=1 Tax=Cytospora paraplurivora TaxID=2898453 RepID=A0AAN9UAD1_9PEZI